MLACPTSENLFFFFFPDYIQLDSNEIYADTTEVEPMDTTEDKWSLGSVSQISPMVVDPIEGRLLPQQPRLSPASEETESLAEAELASLYARQFFDYDFEYSNLSKSTSSIFPSFLARDFINESGLASFLNRTVTDTLSKARERLEAIKKRKPSVESTL